MTDLQAILNSAFKSVPLYVGLVDITNYVGFDPTSDTMSSHPGWQEFTSYSEGARPLWVPGNPSSAYPSQLNNPAASYFTPSTQTTVMGVFLCDNSTKGGTSGQLYGPFFFANGGRSTVAGSQFSVEVNLAIKRNSPWN